MALSEVIIEDIGKVMIFRRKGLKYLRISIGRSGEVRLSLPWYVPKSTGIKYLRSRKDWIKKHQQNSHSSWSDGQKLTNEYVLKINLSDRKTTSKHLERGKLHLYLPRHLSDAQRQEAANRQIKNFLKTETESRLVPLLKDIATTRV